jgi:hypothetical protein
MSQEWLREQALAQQRRAAEKRQKDGDKAQAVNQLQELVANFLKMRQRVGILAKWHAERCGRIVELKAELKSEWERRVAAEQEVAELKQQLGARQNGHPKPVKRTGKAKAGTRA